MAGIPPLFAGRRVVGHTDGKDEARVAAAVGEHIAACRGDRLAVRGDGPAVDGAVVRGRRRQRLRFVSLENGHGRDRARLAKWARSSRD